MAFWAITILGSIINKNSEGRIVHMTMTRPHSNYEKSFIFQLSEDALSNDKNGTPSLRLPPNLTALRKRLE